MEVNPDIYTQAKTIIKEKTYLQMYINTCIEARICPECGEKGLEKYINREGFIEGIDYECRHCNWKWSNLTEE